MSSGRRARFGVGVLMMVSMASGLAACGGDADSDEADSGVSSTIDLAAEEGDVSEGAETTTTTVAADSTAESTDAANGDAPDGDGLDQAPAVVVTDTSFGAAELCMTRDDLVAALPDLEVGPYEDQGPLADTEGVTVTNASGDVEFYALAIVGEGPKLSYFLADTPRYQTAAGVGPGAELAVAASVYGPATLSYSIEGESREYVAFAAGPEAISFRTGTGPQAGVYVTEEGYNETEDYDPQALIQGIEIITFDC